MKYLPAADNARDDVLLHVPASNERKECGNERNPMTKTRHQLL
jgi:hypothetical protein